MKSSLFIIAALLMVTMLGVRPAAALSTDHDSAYANTSGGSRFSDPDDQLSGNQFGSVQLGNSSSTDSNNGPSATFGMSATNSGQTNSPAPGYAMQGCLTPACLR